MDLSLLEGPGFQRLRRTRLGIRRNDKEPHFLIFYELIKKAFLCEIGEVVPIIALKRWESLLVRSYAAGAETGYGGNSSPCHGQRGREEEYFFILEPSPRGGPSRRWLI
jgi:hypothetical protein